MNKKGFTLVELLTVIVLLAIIAAITTPIIINVVNDSKKNAYDEQERLIISAAERWGAEHMQELNSVPGEGCSLPVSDLNKEGYLATKNIKNPKDGKDMGWVEIKKSYDKYTYEYKELSNLDSCKEQEEKSNEDD